ncbi:uncharacterized protein LOC128393644 [Panonychus citri]|uniref:uncharacterized protein LOC128393644 n=1 Tax=Panonychus citri TaxID=50023 RepID=UPI0023073EE3|nr:uncharacterized protein LOC128393644 [Panonychus citri]
MSTIRVLGDLVIFTIAVHLSLSQLAFASVPKAAAANLTAYNTPYAYYDYERDPRQWMGTPYTPYGASVAPLTGGLEAIAIGLLIALGIGIIGFPLVLLLFSLFLGNSGSGLSFVPPASTTTVTGRKRRDVLSNLFPQVPPQLQDRLVKMFSQFSESPDKMAFIKKYLES